MESTNIRLIFSIFGNVFDPINFTKLIGVESTKYWIKGEGVPRRKGITRKESSWEYEISESTLSFEDISTKFDIIFRDKIKIIDQHRKENDLSIKIDLVLEILAGQTPAMYLDRNFINLINKLDAELDMDIYII